MTGGHLTALVRASEISGMELEYDASEFRRELASTSDLVTKVGLQMQLTFSDTIKV